MGNLPPVEVVMMRQSRKGQPFPGRLRGCGLSTNITHPCKESANYYLLLLNLSDYYLSTLLILYTRYYICRRPLVRNDRHPTLTWRRHHRISISNIRLYICSFSQKRFSNQKSVGNGTNQKFRSSGTYLNAMAEVNND